MSGRGIQKLTVTAVMFLTCLHTGIFGIPHEKIKVEVALSNPVLEANRSQKAYLKVGCTGFDMLRTERVPVNLCIVLDRSGSMTGDKIRRAREAALMVVDMLEKDDIFSLVAYESSVRTLVPATRLYKKGKIRKKIYEIEAGGSTALFGGVSKGIKEVRKNLSKRRVNRVILLSDGLANVGPSSPYELGRLGQSAGKEGIAITTIGLGLGYNEDLMTQLAMSSDGNHSFAENSDDLASIFENELGDVLSVVAQDVEIIIRCPEGIRPIRVLDREASIRGQKVTIFLNQLYSRQEKYVLLEVEVPSGKPGSRKQVAEVDVIYNNLRTNIRENTTELAYARFSASKKDVAENINKIIAVQQIKAIANEESRKAVELRDKGNIDSAQVIMLEQVNKLNKQAAILGSDELREESQEMELDAEAMEDEKDWSRTRKSLRSRQYKETNQMSY
jgi:Ca-activated chloride channel homolog